MTYPYYTIRIALTGAIASSFLAFGPLAAAEVTAKRLVNAQNEPQNWLLPYGSYNSHNHSGLAQINRSNVANLKVKFTFSVGGAAGQGQGNTSFQGSSAVENGYLYHNNPWGKLFKIDVRSGTRGQLLWINDAGSERGTRIRGTPALLGNYVYTHPAEADARLLKIDANSGATVWDVSTRAPVEEHGTADTNHSIQPIAVKNQLIMGSTSGVRRNFIAAYDADSGKLLWRFYTVPAPNEPGGKTWADDWKAYMTGRVAIWTQGSYDPDTNLILYGTGEPGPWRDPSYRPGDNLYSNSVVALNVDTGKLAWFFQEIPNESWDYDTVNPKMLVDLDIGGQTRKVQANFSRNGFFYILDRTTGAFQYANPYAEANWTAGLDPKTGMPVEYDPKVLIQKYAPGKATIAGDPKSARNVCPNFTAMPTFQPPTYDASRKTAYVSHQDGCFSPGLAAPYPHQSFVGKDFPGIANTPDVPSLQLGVIRAVDVRTAKVVKEIYTEIPYYSGTLGTAGDLIFTASLDGKFAAYDKDTLNELWSFHAGTSISAPAISYAVDGKQYIAILAGGQDRASNAQQPALKLLQQSPSIYVFGL